MKRSVPVLALALAVLSALTALASPLMAADAPAAAAPAAPAAESSFQQSVLSAMDPKADPCNDFYRYACGGWLDSFKLPADQSRWTRSFSAIAEENREIVRDLLQDAAAHPGEPGTERRKIGDFYASCMNEVAVEKTGLEPLRPWLDAIARVGDARSALELAGRLERFDVGSFLRMGAIADFKHPKEELLFLSQGGLGMPDRDYYVSQDPKKKELLGEYEKHVAKMLELSGTPAAQAASDATAVVGFESELARASRERAQMRDRDKLYHKIDLAGLEKLTPGLDWPRYFTATGYPGLTSINVAVPEFFEGLDKALAAASPETLRAYLRWHLIHSAADYLPQAFVDADFDFYGHKLSGQAEIQPRWKRCVAATNRALGEAIGKLYVEEKFPGKSKEVALEMIRDIEGAFEANLPNLTWMDEVTRGRAVEKVGKVTNKIGYPDKWRDYSKLEIRRGDYLADAMAASSFEFDRDMKKVGGPVDKTEWLMTPQTVNAYYQPTNNEIVFPAGILQPPFFSKDFPAAMNYGGIGAVMGHELTHGFDDQGRKSDGDGVLREWWEPQVSAKFEKVAQCVSDQFSKFEVEPGVHVNGQLTLGENIADLGGVKEAYAAYKAWEAKHGAPPPAVPGLTNDQLLFVSFAQVWCTVQTPEFLRRQVTTDPHSPGAVRAVAAAMNSAAFRQAFSCKAGDKMVADPTCTVW